MSKLARTAAKIIAVLAVLGATSACAPGQLRGASDSNCIEGPIDSAEEARRLAICRLRVVSQACLVETVDDFRYEVTRIDDAWQVRSIAPAASCSTWDVTLSAKDGSVIRFESEP